ncbi:MAG: ABC transporter ATP-binding protein [Victivallales bacterium]|nr:ABC transporter ATP-binding protein [Victivallales bacterium]
MRQGVIHVLNGLSLEVERGQSVALVGRSGCGKTTLLQLLGGLDRPTAGQIWLDGEDLAQLPSSRLTELRLTRIGFVFQSYHLFPELTSLENALLPALHYGQDRGAAEQRARRWLGEFGLESRLDHHPRELSGGEQQRVAIARALINDPDVILADEPTGNLDAKAAAGIMDIILRVCREGHKTLLMVTHDLELASRADRTVKLG